MGWGYRWLRSSAERNASEKVYLAHVHDTNIAAESTSGGFRDRHLELIQKRLIADDEFYSLLGARGDS